MVVSKCFCQVEAAAVAVAVGIVDSKKSGVFQLVDLDFGLDCKPPLRCALAESLAVGAPSRSFLDQTKYTSKPARHAFKIFQAVRHSADDSYYWLPAR